MDLERASRRLKLVVHTVIAVLLWVMGFGAGYYLHAAQVSPVTSSGPTSKLNNSPAAKVAFPTWSLI